ncbi:PspC domain-containing protein [Tessaracoccus antarcticus]|nr:PspC domain-containing protein [Tessaracoccus antarcticus]
MPELVHPSQLDPRLADLQRPLHTGFSGGLCRALAERWRVDPVIVRLVTVALSLAGGVGIALYAWGCLLTPRVGGQAPILRWLPVFGRWSRTSQAIVIAVSSLVLVLSVARQTGVAWGPVIVVGALAWAMARRRRISGDVSAGPPPSPAPTWSPVAPVAPGPGESVEQWRARLSTHTGSPLPTVDLYAPEPTPDTALASPERAAHPTSWWGAIAVLLLTAAAATVPLILGMTPTLLWASVAAGGTAAVSLLVWALVARHRRMPGALLVVALTCAVGSGLLAVSDSQAASTIPLDPTAGGTASYSFVGQADGQLDLTGLPSDTPATVTIDATASVVEVRLAAMPETVNVLTDTTHVEQPSYRGATTTSRLTLVIDGDFSVVELLVAP